MLGGLLSATDPVSVVALLKELGASKKLSTIIEGESLMNDGYFSISKNFLLNKLAVAEISLLVITRLSMLHELSFVRRHLLVLVLVLKFALGLGCINNWKSLKITIQDLQYYVKILSSCKLSRKACRNSRSQNVSTPLLARVRLRIHM